MSKWLKDGDVLELFCCSGGMAEGFRRAGIEIALAFDYSKDACDSYEKNLGHRPICLDVHDLVRMFKAGVRAGWKRPVSLVIADPPCTPWSRAGKRQGLADERDMLHATFAILAEVLPAAFLIGNVPGLDDDMNLPIVAKLLAPFAKRGYCVRDFVRLDAADYGVPQHRIRPFWYAHRVGDCLRIPERTHVDPKELHTLGMFGALPPWVSCRDALGHLPPEEMGRPVHLRYRHTPGAGQKPRASQLDEPAQTIRAKASADLALVNPSSAPRRVRRRAADEANFSSPSEIDKPSRTVRAAPRGAQTMSTLVIAEGTERFRQPSRVDAPARTVTSADGTSGNRLLEWPWSRPSTTVTSRAGLPPPGHHPEAGSIMSMPDAVVLSERAAALLQGFPETWMFVGETKAARWQQIGMAMPPGLAFAVAKEVKRAMSVDRLIVPQIGPTPKAKRRKKSA